MFGFGLAISTFAAHAATITASSALAYFTAADATTISVGILGTVDTVEDLTGPSPLGADLAITAELDLSDPADIVITSGAVSVGGLLSGPLLSGAVDLSNPAFPILTALFVPVVSGGLSILNDAVIGLAFPVDLLDPGALTSPVAVTASIVFDTGLPTVPLPAGGTLLLSGLFGLGAAVRRRAPACA